jgi:hypothetical protein
VWQVGNEIVTGLGADYIRFPELPGNLFSRPTLIWSLSNEGAARHRVEASYLATNVKWNADYVLTVARDDKTADIDGWVTVTNGSGTGFRNATLQLVAGDLNRVYSPAAMMEQADRLETAVANAAKEMTQEAFSDYLLYTLGRKTTVNNNQTKQVSMLDATGFRSPSVTSSMARPSTIATRNIPDRRSRTSSTSTTRSRTRGVPAWVFRCRRSGPCVSVRLQGWDAVRGRGSHPAHPVR